MLKILLARKNFTHQNFYLLAQRSIVIPVQYYSKVKLFTASQHDLDTVIIVFQ